MKDSPEALHTIDAVLTQIPAEVSILRKREVVLAAIGLKKASSLYINFFKKIGEKHGVMNDDEKAQKILDLRKTFRELGLKVLDGEKHLWKSSKDRPLWTGQTFLYGKKAEDLHALASAASENNFEALRTNGRLYGFPETAIEAYVQANREPWNPADENPYLLTLDQEDKLLDETSKRFADFRLSKAHWQEELKIVKTWAEAVQKNAPLLYKKLMEMEA